MIVAVAVGQKGIDTLLVISQIILSIVLPFVMLPLIWLTSSSTVMRVRKPQSTANLKVMDGEWLGGTKSKDQLDYKPTTPRKDGEQDEITQESEVEGEITEEKGCKANLEHGTRVRRNRNEDEDEYIDYSNGPILTIVCYAVLFVVLVANTYLLVSLVIY